MAGILDYPPSKRGEPVWAIAGLYPSQGSWTEDDYLSLETNHLIEYDNGALEFLPMPKIPHQRIVAFLFDLLRKHTRENGGEVLAAPTRLKVGERKYREPDLVYLADPDADEGTDEYFASADLVVEVVSPGADNRARDYKRKRADYASLGVAEYWIVDPEDQLVTVLTLRAGKYAEHCKAKPGQKAESALLKGFAAEVSAILKK